MKDDDCLDPLIINRSTARSLSMGGSIIASTVTGILPLPGDTKSKGSRGKSTDTDDQSSIKDGQAEVKTNSFLLVKLKQGVSKINITSLYLGNFLCCLVLIMETVFGTYLLEQHYDLDPDEAAIAAGNLGFVGDLGAVSSELFVGYALDLFGRKTVTITGLAVASFAVTMKPVPQHIGYLYILRFFTNVGCIPMLYTPYALDYVKHDSLGLYCGYSQVMSTIANMIATTFAI